MNVSNEPPSSQHLPAQTKMGTNDSRSPQLSPVPVLQAQGGVRAYRGTLGQALRLHELMQTYSRSVDSVQHPPVIAFLDIKAAYDSVNRPAIWDTL